MRASTLCRSAALFAVATFLLSASAEAGKKKKKKKKKTDDEIVDVSAVKSQFLVFTDGDGGYFATIRMDMDHLFYGDGKTFHQQRAFSGGANGNNEWSFRMWAPRVENVADLDIKNAVGTIACGKDEFELTQVSATEATKIIDSAVFKKPLWTRQGHALSRDDKGTYYFVDRLRDEYGGKGYRLFAGQKGAMKELGLTNIVSDSKGQIFSSKKGELRFVQETDSATWIKNEKKTTLVNVPIEDNLSLVYGELGVYEGSLGTPCDDY
jgi:hypothetical protein